MQVLKGQTGASSSLPSVYNIAGGEVFSGYDAYLNAFGDYLINYNSTFELISYN